MKRPTTTIPTMSLHRQLLLIFSIGITLLAVAASITTAWVTSRQVRTVLISEGLQVTGNLAEQSVLALLYDSGENATDAVRTTLAFPAVIQVTIFNAEHQSILERGGASHNIPLDDTFLATDGQAQLVTETPREWHFIAPVYTPENTRPGMDILFPEPVSKRELPRFRCRRVCASHIRLSSRQRRGHSFPACHR